MRLTVPLLFFALLFLAPVSAQAAPPNVLVVLSDDHAAPHLGCYGTTDIRTPNLDRFAAEGMRFNRAYVCSPQCVPSRAGMMACRSPVGIGMTRFSAPFPAEITAYPDLLKQANYFIGLAGRTYHLDGAGPAEMQEIHKAHKLDTFGERFDFAEKSGKTDEILAQYRKFLDAVPKDRPFYLQLCFSDPHRAYTADDIPQPHDPATITLPKHFPDTPAVRADFASYYNEIARFDQNFGEVEKELKDRGLQDNTLVLFIGDNGAAQWRGKGTLYEFGVHVPLLARWPGKIKAGTVSNELISAEDLGATILAAAELAPAKGMTGRSFLPLLTGGNYDARKYVFCERGPHGSGLPTNSAAFDLGRCVISKTHKFIYTATNTLPYFPVDFGGSPMAKEVFELASAGKLPPEICELYKGGPRPMFELYDLVNDPAELHNLIDDPAADATELELRSALEEWMILERDYLPIPVIEGKKPKPQPK